MSKENIEKARQNSVNKERKKVTKRMKKIVNYVKLLVLVTSILASINIARKIDFSSPDDFSQITYGEDYEKEFDDVKSLIESYLNNCIRVKINKDTHRSKDSNGIDTGNFYYNFSGYEDYEDVFFNLELLINQFKMDVNDISNFKEYISSLSKEEKQAILVYYGSGMVQGNARESFKNSVGNNLENMSDEDIKNIAENTVDGITTNYLDGKWYNDNLGRGRN